RFFVCDNANLDTLYSLARKLCTIRFDNPVLTWEILRAIYKLSSAWADWRTQGRSGFRAVFFTFFILGKW
ncbi:MAG: hypothetical protein M3N42_01280, partial [Cyanobacteriota bacterium]|nr:hypothetical protein [Cyanobacteriota bacterium]